MNVTKTILIFLIIFISFFDACKNGKTKVPENIITVKLQQEWFPNSNYAGAVFAKYVFAQRYGLEIDVLQGSENTDPIKTVLSGEAEFGDASADRIIQANDKGADLVIIGVVNINSPTCFISKIEKNIKTPYDFIGKKVGILTGTNTELIYFELMKKLNINRKKINEIEIPFDLATFIANQYDVRPAFIYDEPVSLDLKKIRYDIIEPKNYGVSFMGTVYFTTKELITTKPQLVQAFINAIADGWGAGIKHPEEAIGYVKKLDNSIDSLRELTSLVKGLEYYRGKDNKILYAEENDFDKMVNTLFTSGIIKKKILPESFNNEFIKKYLIKHDEL
jgi:NitT/TauT family transport system substrate-binding protein